MRKLFISADIEGCAAVASQHALSSKEWEWPKACEWMTNEVSAACVAALDAGYDEIVVADGHGNAQNIIPDQLPSQTRLVRSWPRPFLQMEGVQDPQVEGCFFIGYHNGVQGEGGILAHTYYGAAIRDLRLNGVSASEGYMNAALAGEFGKPILLVSGDAAATKDAIRYAPNAELCTVKEAIGWRSQAAPTPAEACDLIRAAAAKTLRPNGEHAPFRIRYPIELELEMTARLAAEMLGYLPWVRLSGPYTARVEFKCMAEAMKFISFAILYSPTGVIAF